MTKTYDIKRGDTIIATVKPTGYISEAIMGDSSAVMSFALSSFVAFHIGDTVRIDQIEFILNTEPSFTKKANNRYEYQLNFQGYKFELAKTAFLSLGDDNSLKEVDFSLMGKAEVFVDLIVANLNRDSSGWMRGEVDDTGFKNLPFSEQNCLSALADLAVEFKTEYWISGKIIHLTKKGNVSGLNLQYGRGNGLYEISRSQPSDKNVFTRIIPRGGTKNIPGSYRGSSTRLQLPAGINYLERNVDKYGVIELPKTYEDVFPRYEGKITAIGNEFTFTDSGIDFNVNSQLLPGVTAKVTFNTGQLAGYIFDISSYDHATRTVVIKANTDEKAINVPSELLRPAIGDEYVFIDIDMPDSYILAGELELKEVSQADLIEGSDPYAEYRVTPDPLQFKRNSTILILGDYVHLTDLEIGINEDIRIIGYRKDIQDYFKYTEINLATVVVISKYVRDYAELEKTQRAVRSSKLTDPALLRRNYKTTQEMLGMMFDPDGYFTDKIRPGSIETGALAVGAKSQQFVLNGVLFTPSYQGSQAKFRATAGILDHYTIADNIRSWNLQAYSNDTLSDGTAYYIYAKCNKVSTAGAFLLSTQKITVDEDVAFYHFLLGTLSSPIDGVRVPALIYGLTTIAGRYIKTDVITSNDGQTYFDLDAGVIGGKIVFSAGSSGYDNLEDKPDLSVFAEQDYVDSIREELQNQIDGQITNWFYAYVPTLANIPAVDWNTTAIKDNHLNDLFYNTATGYAYRFIKTGSVYSWSRITDTDILAAMAAAAAAQDTADNKRRVFTTNPTTPYDIGDLWAQGTGGELMRCNIAKTAAQSFSTADWGKASKYTDDTAVLELQSYVDVIKDELQSQIDGQITSWFYAYVPSLSNAPATEWTTNAIRDNHLGDLFYNTATGYAYRYMKMGSVYSWGRISDTDVITALANAAKAQDTADSKRRVFVITPVVPYDVGDLWTQGTGGELMRCTNAKTIAQSYSASDWVKAVKYTDDTATNALQASLGDLAYNDMVSAAKLDETIITGGHIKSTLLDVNAIIVSGGIETTSGAQAKSNAAQTAAINAAAADATTKSNNAKTAAETAAKAYAVAQDLLLKAEQEAYADGLVTAEEQARIDQATANLNAAKADATTKANAAQAAAIAAAALDATAKANTAKTAAETAAKAYADDVAIAKANAAQAAAILAASSDAQAKATAAYNNAVSASNTFATTVANDKATAAQIAAAADASNKATTAYNNAVAAAAAQYSTLTSSLKSLAYQNLSDLAVSGNTLILGGKINTVLLDAAAIRANIINAAYIEALNIVSKSIATAASGKRVEITAFGNDINFYDSSGNVVVRVDDDAVVEDRIFHANAVPPFWETVYGPGVRAGDTGGKATYIGRKGLQTTNIDGSRQHLLGTNLGNSNGAIVDLDAGGGVYFRAMTGDPTGGLVGTQNNIIIYADIINTPDGYKNVISWKPGTYPK